MLATDFTYDLFVEDAKKYTATAIKGVHCRRNADEREHFMVWLKNAARDFKETWMKSHKGLYDRHDGYIGDAFAQTLDDWFSDFYKDTYGQRPHLDNWYYVHALGLPMQSDIARTFCADPVELACSMAKWYRCEE